MGVVPSELDRAYMQRALALAGATTAHASPNPQVGCVLVRDGVALGEGAHRYLTRDHAEIVAMEAARAAGHSLQGATAYVTLEPCSHQGRTGPCADALVGAGITRCFVATVDPNPLVSGGGIARLRAAGVEVHISPQGSRERSLARGLNNAFAWSITRGRPFVTLKSALSIDGRLAPSAQHRTAGEPFWLTGAEARAEVQRMRHGSDAVLTGIGTVLADDPLLTDRSGLSRRRSLERIVLDPSLRTPRESKLNRTATSLDAPWYFCSRETTVEDRDRFAAGHVGRVSVLPETKENNLRAVLEELHESKVLHVLLECGSALNGAFLNADLVDEAVLFFAPVELGPDSLPFARNAPDPFALCQRLSSVEHRLFGVDACVSGLLHDPWAGTPEIG